MSKQYCSKCREMVEPKNYGAGEFCSKCFNYFNGSPTLSNVTQEAMRNEASIEISLTESFEDLGLSEEGARIAAKGRGSSDVPNDVASDRGKLEASLTESFQEMGLTHSAAKQAAKGRR